MPAWLDVLTLVSKFEGPYKWYIIGGIIFLMTAVFSRFVFKTIKWFLLLIAIGVIVLAVWGYFMNS